MTQPLASLGLEPQPGRYQRGPETFFEGHRQQVRYGGDKDLFCFSPFGALSDCGPRGEGQVIPLTTLDDNSSLGLGTSPHWPLCSAAGVAHGQQAVAASPHSHLTLPRCCLPLLLLLRLVPLTLEGDRSCHKVFTLHCSVPAAPCVTWRRTSPSAFSLRVGGKGQHPEGPPGLFRT